MHDAEVARITRILSSVDTEIDWEAYMQEVSGFLEVRLFVY